MNSNIRNDIPCSTSPAPKGYVTTSGSPGHNRVCSESCSSLGPRHACATFLHLCICVMHRGLPVWWITLFATQVRRHPWWDRPTVHHSPAFLHCIHSLSSHSGATWQMARARNALADIGPFFPTFSSDCFFLYLFLLSSAIYFSG